jgi:hypothetical protein
MSRWLWPTGLVLAFWQAVMILLGPAPGSYLKSLVDPYTLPYLRLLNLDNRWAFFAPNPGRGRLVSVRYGWNDGTVRTAELTRALDRWHPAYLRYTSLLSDIHDGRPGYVESAAHHLCRLYPQARTVQFVIELQLAPSAEEVVGGLSPLDERFLEREDLAPVDCP